MLPLSQPGVAREVTSKLPQGWALFLGNSMPIRDVDMYCSGPRQRPGRLARASPGWDQPSAGAGGVPVMANRGASGIDGVLSTAIGAAEGLGRGVTLLVGDVSALHDSNGLSMLQEARGRPPVVVVLVNNGGGGIFSFLPVQDSIPASVFGAVFATPPGVDFGSLARAHGVLHRTVRRATDLPAALAEAWGSGEHCIVEVFTDRDSNTAVHRAIQARVAAAVAAAAPLLSGQAVCDVPESAVGIIGPLDVACRPYAVPLRRPVTTGARDDVRRGLLVEVSVSAASGGAPCRGLGEVAPLPGLHVESMERAREEAEMMAHLLRGKRAPLSAFLVLGGPLEWVARATGVAPDVLCPSVRAGIEAALLSAAADRLGVPLAKLLAAAAGDRAVTGDEDVPVCGLVSDSNPESAATRAAELADAGHVAVKLKVGRADAETDARVVTAVLGAVQGRRVSVRADANRAWAAPDAEAFLRAVGGALEFIEEPLRDAAGLRALSGSLGVDVALDETLDAAASGKTPGGGAYVSQREECARVDISEGGRVKSGAGESGRGDYGAAEAAGAAVREAGARTVVLKPSVLGGLHRSLEIAQVAKRSGCGRVVVSSAFESSVAVATCSSLAQALGSDGTAHGLGTLDWLATDAVPVRLAVEPTSAGAGFRGSSIDAVLRQSLGESDPGQAAVKVTRSTHAVHLGGGVFEAGVLRVMPPEGASPVRRPVVFLHGFLGERGWSGVPR